MCKGSWTFFRHIPQNSQIQELHGVYGEQVPSVTQISDTIRGRIVSAFYKVLIVCSNVSRYLTLCELCSFFFQCLPLNWTEVQP